MNLFLDIETTGLPAKGLEWVKDYLQFPNIVQIAWINVSGVEKEFIIYQEGKEVPIEASNIHGITSAIANDPNNTWPLKKVLQEFLYDAIQAERIVGFNIYFDSSIVKAAILRVCGPESEEAVRMLIALDKDRRVDVMRLIQMNHRDISGGKWMKLLDVYRAMFGEEYEAHSALLDCVAVKRIHAELPKRTPVRKPK